MRTSPHDIAPEGSTLLTSSGVDREAPQGSGLTKKVPVVPVDSKIAHARPASAVASVGAGRAGSSYAQNAKRCNGWPPPTVAAAVAGSRPCTPRDPNRGQSEENGQLLGALRFHRPETPAQALMRLSSPLARGPSDQARRRAAEKLREQSARKDAAAIIGAKLPPAEKTGHAFGDTWHMYGEDGYASALVHAAVRCKEVLHNAGDGSAPVKVATGASGGKQLVFGAIDRGSSEAADDAEEHSIPRGPELVRLQMACMILQELCNVSSPLQDTLRYLNHEFSQCLFRNYTGDRDVKSLLPFFVEAVQLRDQLAKNEQELSEARAASETWGAERERLESQLAQAQVICASLQARVRDFEQEDNSATAERNHLQSEVSHLQQVSALRAEELRDLDKELLVLQAKEHTECRALQEALHEISALTGAAREQQAKVERLQRQLADMHHAAGLSRKLARRQNEAPKAQEVKTSARPSPRAEAPSDLEAVVAQAQTKKQRQQELPNDIWSKDAGQRLLKMEAQDGHLYVLLRGRSDEPVGTQVAEHGFDHVTTLIVSGEVLTAAAISRALPEPLDMSKFEAGDDEAIVGEVYRDVYAMATENGALLGLVRNLRREVKSIMELVPEWNQDEVSGLLHRSLALDTRAFDMMRDTLGSGALVALGDGPEVPRFLRYEGILPKCSINLIASLSALWLERTESNLDALALGASVGSLSEYVNDTYLPSVASARKKQMEYIYNFLIALRKETSMSEPDSTPARTSRGPRKGTGSRSARIPSKGPARLGSKSSARSGSKGMRADAAPVIVNTSAMDSSERLKALFNLQPKTLFTASAEVLYRSLLGHLHEDLFHDQTAMLAALCTTVAAFGDRLVVPSVGPVAGVAFDKVGSALADNTLTNGPILMGLAEFSAILRLFFPAKPRKHLSSLKQQLLPRVRKGTGGAEGGVNAGEVVVPDVVDVSEVFGCDLKRGALPSREELLAGLVLRPSPLVLELRRQHIIECFMFVDRLRKAFRAVITRVGDRPTGASLEASGNLTLSELSDEKGLHATLKQADAALHAADNRLTVTQRHIYLLRGFGRNIPDVAPYLSPHAAFLAMNELNATSTSPIHGAPGSIGGAATSEKPPGFASVSEPFTPLTPRLGSATQSPVGSPTTRQQEVDQLRTNRQPWGSVSSLDIRLRKVRRLLQERVKQLEEENLKVRVDVFITRLAESGVTKGTLLWRPNVSLAEVMQEAGLMARRAVTPSSALEHFVAQDVADEQAAGNGKQEEDEGEVGNALACYRQLASKGSSVQELSVGYATLMLLHWLRAVPELPAAYA